MNNNELEIEKVFKQAFEKGKKDLEAMSALDLMSNSAKFHRQLTVIINSLHVPPAIVIGILMTEVHRLCAEVDELTIIRAFEKVIKYVDENDSLVKKYVAENFIRKE